MSESDKIPSDSEEIRLEKEQKREENWKRWGPYLAERQWGTVREDYSADGDCWNSFTHEQSRSRAYRWGEDGLLGITDRECRLCFAFAFWNENDPILKERLYGLNGFEGNHGEDVKELYWYLDALPTHSYMKMLYNYPQDPYPYKELVEKNQQRGKEKPEFELSDTGIFHDNRWFDIFVEYAKESPNDILVRLTIRNCAQTEAPLHVLPQLWFRNTWIWGCEHEGCTLKPRITKCGNNTLRAQHETLEDFKLACFTGEESEKLKFLFTENESNTKKLWSVDSYTPYVKDAFHQYVVEKRRNAVNSQSVGTKAAAHYKLSFQPQEEKILCFRLFSAEEEKAEPLNSETFNAIFEKRIKETDEFYRSRVPETMDPETQNIRRQAYAGLLWNKQFYHYSIKDWLKGDSSVMTPPAVRWKGRNSNWLQLFNRDVISMPDKWEYPWYAAWDLAFHMIPFSTIDPVFAKQQMILMLREWYMHPNGQLPAYEFAFDDVNPPVHAWAAFEIYKKTAKDGNPDVKFLARIFQKLLINFTWWVNRKDPEGKNLFAGGFLGLDNIGVFDRSKPLPEGGHLEQADGTAWMAFYCISMLEIAIELAEQDSAYEDVASKFFEHFTAVADAMNSLGGTGLWDEEDGFYYDRIHVNGNQVPLKIKSMVGLIPLFAVGILDECRIRKFKGFTKRMNWFLTHRKDLAKNISYMEAEESSCGKHLLALPSRERLQRVLRIMLDENEFLSPFGVRSLSAFHRENPYTFHAGGRDYTVKYIPGEADSALFGGNSNWRGPIWFPVNYLIIQSLKKYHNFYGDSFQIECPTGSGNKMNLLQTAHEIEKRLAKLFQPDEKNHRPSMQDFQKTNKNRNSPHVLFHEYFHGDNGRGLGASHQTGWTALIASILEDLHFMS